MLILISSIWERKKEIFKSCQVCDWLAKWLMVLGFMDLRWPRVYRRSNVGLVSEWSIRAFTRSVEYYNSRIVLRWPAVTFIFKRTGASYGKESMCICWICVDVWNHRWPVDYLTKSQQCGPCFHVITSPCFSFSRASPTRYEGIAEITTLSPINVTWTTLRKPSGTPQKRWVEVFLEHNKSGYMYIV